MRWVILVSALAALAAKVYCAATTIGTTDVILFHMFGKKIAASGLLAMYRETPMFNHTPLVGGFAAACWHLEEWSGVSLAFFLRLPGIVADFAAVFALVWLRARTGHPPGWGIVLFALSPVAFMISGYHGNVDSVLAAILLLATCACVGEKARPLACGILLGLACNVKVVALLLGPLFFFFWWHRQRARPFAAGAIVTTLVGWAYPLVTIPHIFLKNVLGYGGYWGDWGITYLLTQAGWNAFAKGGFVDLSPEQHLVLTGLKVVIVASAITLAWRSRAADAPGLFTALAGTWAVMFVFGPGGAPQYLVWLAAFILLESALWYSAVTAGSAVFLFVFYQTISHGLPWYKGISTSALALHWRPWNTLPWLIIAAFLAHATWRGFRARTKLTPSPEPTTH